MQDLKDHLKHRLNPKTIANEFVKTMEERVQPQGADELANALFTGSGYLPWPNQGQELIEPMPNLIAESEPAASEPLKPLADVDRISSADDYMNGYADHPANRYRDMGLDR